MNHCILSPDSNKSLKSPLSEILHQCLLKIIVVSEIDEEKNQAS